MKSTVEVMEEDHARRIYGEARQGYEDSGFRACSDRKRGSLRREPGLKSIRSLRRPASAVLAGNIILFTPACRGTSCVMQCPTPEGPFVFGGVIVSNGDIGLEGGQTAYDANNHGGIVDVNGQYYIFYHRHTHGTHFSRQGCAEKIGIKEDGTIAQTEITSCGLNAALCRRKRIRGIYYLQSARSQTGLPYTVKTAVR